MVRSSAPSSQWASAGATSTATPLSDANSTISRLVKYAAESVRNHFRALFCPKPGSHNHPADGGVLPTFFGLSTDPSSL